MAKVALLANTILFSRKNSSEKTTVTFSIFETRRIGDKRNASIRKGKAM
ncbi:MAG: hypothetical protein SOV38_08045 [Prevotella sp.]|nr:hypothetical protein [Prevotella sp.]